MTLRPKNNPQLIPVHVPMLGPVDRAAIRRDRHLKHTAVVVMNPPAYMRGMLVLAILFHVETRLKSRQLVQKTPPPLGAGRDQDRLVTKATFHAGVVPVVGGADAGCDSDRPFEGARRAGPLVDRRIRIEHHADRSEDRRFPLADDHRSHACGLRPMNTAQRVAVAEGSSASHVTGIPDPLFGEVVVGGPGFGGVHQRVERHDVGPYDEQPFDYHLAAGFLQTERKRRGQTYGVTGIFAAAAGHDVPGKLRFGPPSNPCECDRRV